MSTLPPLWEKNFTSYQALHRVCDPSALCAKYHRDLNPKAPSQAQERRDRMLQHYSETLLLPLLSTNGPYYSVLALNVIKLVSQAK